MYERVGNLLSRYSLVYGLFNDDVSTSDHIASDDRMINELEIIWKEAVMAEIKELSQHLPGQRKTMKSPSG
jgi:hypothetical protein